MTKNHFRKLEQGFSVPLPADEDGFVGRECPNEACLGRFMVKFGTGLKGENLPCICPYCGHKGPHDQFLTKEQAAYLESVVLREVSKAFRGMVGEWDKDLRRQTRGGLIQMQVDFKAQHKPIRYYQEKSLETEVTCVNCTLAYKIYGEFAYCPDCGIHNSLQILQKNLELARKELDLAAGQDVDFADHLTRDALENCVSAFDGFGRELARIHADKSNDPDRASRISFQNLDGVQKNLLMFYGIDLAAGVFEAEWDELRRAFQKRHVLAHKMGVADAEYVAKAKDPNAVEGRKILVSANEVRNLIELVLKLAHHLLAEFDKLP